MESAKIVATPTLFSWSQVYNAGKLFAAVSMHRNPPTADEENPQSLNEIGKMLLEKLEQEFFTVENKDLASINQAIVKTFTDFPDNIIYSFSAAVVTDNILYAFSKNGGHIFIKRGEKLGKILDEGISSGFLQDKDLIVLTTKPFADLFSQEELSKQITNQSPKDLAENLSPKVHEKEEGGASAILIQFTQTQASPEPEIIQQEEPQDEKAARKLNLPDLKAFALNFIGKIKLPHLPISNLNHKRKIFLTLSLVIFLLLIFSVFSAIKKQEDSKREALFGEIYP